MVALIVKESLKQVGDTRPRRPVEPGLSPGPDQPVPQPSRRPDRLPVNQRKQGAPPQNIAMEVVVTCPECGLHAKVLPYEDCMIENIKGKCPYRTNPLNCPNMRLRLSIGRQELNERLRAVVGRR